MTVNLRERITLQSKSVTRNGIGEESVTWNDLATVWAEARPVRGQELYAANQVQQTLDVRFFIRRMAGVTADLRLVWNSEHYDITGVIPGTGPYLGFLEIMAIKGVRNGRNG